MLYVAQADRSRRRRGGRLVISPACASVSSPTGRLRSDRAGQDTVGEWTFW